MSFSLSPSVCEGGVCVGVGVCVCVCVCVCRIGFFFCELQTILGQYFPSYVPEELLPLTSIQKTPLKTSRYLSSVSHVIQCTINSSFLSDLCNSAFCSFCYGDVIALFLCLFYFFFLSFSLSEKKPANLIC